MAAGTSSKAHFEQSAHGMAHKARNALNAMRTQIALLEKFTSPAGEARVAQQLQKLGLTVLGLEELIKEYLALVSPEKAPWEELNPAALLGEVLGFLALDLERERITVLTEFAPDLPAVCADRDRLKRALLNLIINARQAMPEGGRLTLRTRSPAPDRVRIEISDTGCGIAPEQQARVFEPFYSTKAGALGLGLTMARDVVNDLHGRLRYEARDGPGTTFRIILPSAHRLQATLQRRARSQQWT
jgi:signal transduction histidine kinase